MVRSSVALPCAAAIGLFVLGGCSTETRADIEQLFADEDEEPSREEIEANMREMRERAAEGRQSLEKAEAQADQALAGAEAEMEEALAEMDAALTEAERR